MNDSIKRDKLGRPTRSFHDACIRGHDMTGDPTTNNNIRITRKKRHHGWVDERVCKACHTIHARRYEERKAGRKI